MSPDACSSDIRMLPEAFFHCIVNRNIPVHTASSLPRSHRRSHTGAEFAHKTRMSRSLPSQPDDDGLQPACFPDALGEFRTNPLDQIEQHAFRDFDRFTHYLFLLSITFSMPSRMTSAMITRLPTTIRMS